MNSGSKVWEGKVEVLGICNKDAGLFYFQIIKYDLH